MHKTYDSLSVTLEEIGDVPALEGQWRALEGQCDASFFQSWAWIGSLLEAVMPDIRPKVLTVSAGDSIVGLGLLTAAKKRRHGFVSSSGLYLNETGRDDPDGLTIEYNGLMARRGAEREVTAAALGWLVARGRDWNELYLSGLAETEAERISSIAGELGLKVWVRDIKPCDYADLGALAEGGKGAYLAGLSRNTRYQIRRAIKLYGGDEVKFECARTAPEALEFLDRLKQLHQAHWRARGQAGAFANRFFERFHKSLIERDFDRGAIQLCRISEPGGDIGYLYNFIRDGRVSAYQSGFRYDRDAKLKPGLVSHFLAIEHNIKLGATVYDFLAGEGRHKASLGNRRIDMKWLVVQRNEVVFRLEHGLRRLKQKISAARQKAG